jgi:hypothetical protein
MEDVADTGFPKLPPKSGGSIESWVKWPTPSFQEVFHTWFRAVVALRSFSARILLHTISHSSAWPLGASGGCGMGLPKKQESSEPSL